ncbi:Hint domain-containing protein, partial [Streptomyces sp. NPDC001260]|uniref:Hint domain-containing protein n=1 Tax=Streptomyces sp. NPDC001260 TaxID=3364551 RepID=UPI0036B88FE7
TASTTRPAPTAPPDPSCTAQRTITPSETVSKTHYEIYPGVFVNRSWKYKEKYAQKFWQEAANWCQEAGSSCLTEPAEDEQVAQNILTHLKFLACMRLGHESGCGGQFSPLGAVAMIAMTGGTEGPAGLGGGGIKLPGGCKCFLAGTDVLMADGSTKKIEDVKLGDRVKATDPETGKTKSRKVTRLIRTEGDKYFNELSIATKNGIEKLTATHEHPFWSPSEHDWTPAGALKPGMTLRTDDGSTVIVTGNRSFTKHARTYNLTVDELHTYYVLAGATPVLVHNASCPSFKTSKPIAGPLPDVGQTSFYAIVSSSGKLVKWGISGNPVGRYSRRQIEEMGGSHMQIIKNFDTKRDALDAERYMVERHPGPANFEDYRGAVAPSQSWEQDLRYATGGGLFRDLGR